MVQTFYAVSGGSWSRRPAGIDTLWRLQNVQVTLGPWSLNELEFYDPWCFFPKMFLERLVWWEVFVGVSERSRVGRFGWPWEGGLGGDFLGVNLGWIFF